MNAQPESSVPQFTFEPRSFVKNWKMDDFSTELKDGINSSRDFANGRKMAGAGSCYVCHRFNGEGGAVGPDLTSQVVSLGLRFAGSDHPSQQGNQRPVRGYKF